MAEEEKLPAKEIKRGAVVNIWRRLIRKAQESKSRTRFTKDAKEILEFYHGPHKQLFVDATTWHPFHDSAQVTINKTSQYVSTFGPTLYNKNPTRTVTPKRTDPLSIALAAVLSDYLNYTPEETGLRREGRLFVDEALIYGRGALWTELYEATGPINQKRAGSSEQKKAIVRTKFEPIDNIEIDPDCERIEEAYWIARKKQLPVWEVKELYGERAEGLEAERIPIEKNDETKKDDKTDGASLGASNELVTVWEIWSKMGLGFRSKVVMKEREEEDDELDDDTDYKYIVLAFGHKRPLHIGKWPVPYYLDGDWPVTFLDFLTLPREPWPIAPLKPALGIQKAIDFVASFLIEKTKNHAKHIVGVDEDVYDEVCRVLKEGRDLPVLKMPTSNLQKQIGDRIGWVKPPEVGTDLKELLAMLERLFEEHTGLTEILMGLSDRAFRSAEEARLKDRNSRLRIDDMADEVEYALTRAARKEALLALYTLSPEEIARIVSRDKVYGYRVQVTQFATPFSQEQARAVAPGAGQFYETQEEAESALEGVRAMLPPAEVYSGMDAQVVPSSAAEIWTEALASQSTEDIAREFHYHVESGSARRQDRNWSIDMTTMMMESVGAKALELGQVTVYNRVLDFQYETLGIPPSKRAYLEEMPPPAAPGEAAPPPAGMPAPAASMSGLAPDMGGM